MTFQSNGRPWFLYSGEIHYFRVDREDWAARLETARATGLNTVATYVPWSVHEPIEGRIDLSMLDDYVAAVAAAGLKLFIRVGPIANAELNHEGLPAWLALDPDAQPRAVVDGPPHWCGPSYLAPRYLAAIGRWYDALLPRVAALQSGRGGPVVAVQLCNEIAMIPWVCRFADRAAHVEAAYRSFLKERYDDIRNIAVAYGRPELTSFDALAQPDAAPSGKNLLPHLDRARFFRSYYAEYYRRLAEMASAYGITEPLIANIPMFWDYDTRGRGHQAPLTVSIFSRFADAVPGVSLGGAYQMRRLDHENSHDIAIATEATRAATRPSDPAKPAGDVLCVELQTGILCDRPRLYPPDVDLNIRISAGHGLAGINAYMFAGGRNAPGQGTFGMYHEWQAPIASDGTTRPHLAPMETFGRFVEGFGPLYAASAKMTTTAIGFYAPYWMTEHILGPESARFQSLREQTAFDGVWRILDLIGRPFRFLDLESPHALDSSSLWVFTLERMDADVQKRLAEYVSEGGTLVLWPRVPVIDFRGEPCTVLADALGIRSTVRARELPYIGESERHIGTDIETIATEGDDDVLARCRDGAACAIVRGVGKGRVLFIGFGIEDKFLYWRTILGEWCDRIGMDEAIKIRPFGEIGAQFREGERGSFLTVSNPHELEIRGEVDLRHRHYSTGHLTLPPRGAWVLPVGVDIGNGDKLAQANAEVQSVEKTEAGYAIRFRTPALGDQFRALIIRRSGQRVRVQGPANEALCEVKV